MQVYILLHTIAIFRNMVEIMHILCKELMSEDRGRKKFKHEATKIHFCFLFSVYNEDEGKMLSVSCLYSLSLFMSRH